MIIPLRLGHVLLPSFHPRAPAGSTPIIGYAIDHPDGVILVDTGCGTGNAIIDELYQPTVVNLIDALWSAGIDERSVGAIVNTHLHFDHCGQNDVLGDVAVWTTADELSTVAAEETYTIAEWAEIPTERLRVASDDEEIATGVRLLATPGHTPGHQSVVVTGFDERPDVIVGQACYNCAEMAGHTKRLDGDLHHPDLADAARCSMLRLQSLRPSSAYFSHDPLVYCSP